MSCSFIGQLHLSYDRYGRGKQFERLYQQHIAQAIASHADSRKPFSRIQLSSKTLTSNVNRVRKNHNSKDQAATPEHISHCKRP
jgi:hypothetical protein